MERSEPQQPDPTWERLESQLNWYDRKSSLAQRDFKVAKVLELIVAASVPVLAGLQAFAAVTASVAAVVVVFEGIQQLFQWQTNWVLYRSTAEALKHERYLYLAHAGPYQAEDRHVLLAERIEGLVSQEHAKWVSDRSRKDPTRRGGDAAAADGPAA